MYMVMKRLKFVKVFSFESSTIHVHVHVYDISCLLSKVFTLQVLPEGPLQTAIAPGYSL